MELHDFMRSRRSIRRFRGDLVPEPLIERILLTAAHAPSAHNRQPWRFCVISKAEIKRRLADAMAIEFRRDLLADNLAPTEVNARIEASRSKITSAPLVVVLCMDMTEMDSYPDGRRAEAERMMAIQSTAAAGLQLLLAAHAEGISGVWTCGPLFAPAAVVAALELPPAWEPQAMFFLGYADQEPRPKSIKSLDACVKTF